MISNINLMGTSLKTTNDIILMKSVSIKSDKYKVINTQTSDHNIIIARIGK